MNHKAGFVSIVGKPNAGKSTLLNTFLGEELSAVNPKAQTTRHRIKGILNSEDYQVVFSDTPGIMKPAYKLHERMLDTVKESFEDADLILYLTEVRDRNIDEALIERFNNLDVPLYIVINKVDESSQPMVEEASGFWKETFPKAEVFPISALHKFYTDVLLSHIVHALPEAPPFFEKDDNLSDRNLRFFVAEIIRERILEYYKKEIPYSVEVVVTSYKESEDIDRITAVIYCARESQKAILLGHQGSAIKKMGTEARKRIEGLAGKKVYLELTVKVLADWRDNDKYLRDFGYGKSQS